MDRAMVVPHEMISAKEISWIYTGALRYGVTTSVVASVAAIT
jgi:hypothetical protein